MFPRGPLLNLGNIGDEVPSLRARLGCNLRLGDDSMLGKEWGEEVVEPGERQIEKDIVAGDSPIIGEVGGWASLMNGGDVGGFKAIGKM